MPAETLSFTEDLVLLSPIKGWAMTIDQATYNPISNVGDGSVIYVEITRSPGSAVSLVPRVANVVPSDNDSILIGYRVGTVLYLRNGTGYDNGDSGTIYAGGSGASAITAWSRHQITVGTNGDDWFDKTQSAASQGALATNFSDALFSPNSLDVFINNTLCHYIADVSTKDLNWWTWVTTGAPSPVPVIQLGSTGSAPQAGDIVTIKYPR
jgi:hypothetical protein